MAIRIIQVTDCHLFADPNVELKGMVTRSRFEVTIAAIRDRFSEFDRLIITGDLAHDEALSTYQQLRELLGDFADRTRVIPGNHDNREFMTNVFPRQNGEPELDRVTFSERLGGWRIVGLDTHLPGKSSGRLGDPQLGWFRHQLDAEPEANCIVFTHHPPMDVQSLWLDEIGLQDRDALRSVIRDCPQVRLLCSGHVHQEVASVVESAVALTTPSIGPEFAPRTEQLVVSEGAPGYRVIELMDDGSWWSQTYRATS